MCDRDLISFAGPHQRSPPTEQYEHTSNRVREGVHGPYTVKVLCADSRLLKGDHRKVNYSNIYQLWMAWDC